MAVQTYPDCSPCLSTPANRLGDWASLVARPIQLKVEKMVRLR